MHQRIARTSVGVTMAAMAVAGHAFAQKGIDLQPLAPSKSSADLPRGDDLVDVHLFAEAPAVSRGGRTWLAVRFVVEPDWHIYWHNPGDSGGPPRFAWEVPDGVEVGEARWPVPSRHVYSSGDALDFVFYDQATVLFPIEVSESFAGDQATVSLRSDYLVCKDVCLFGGGEASVDVSVGDMVTHVVQHQDVFDPARRALPSDETGPATARWRGRTVELRVPGAAGIEVFPHRLPNGVRFENLPERGVADTDHLRLRLEGDLDALGHVDLTIRATIGDEEVLRTLSVERG